MPSNFQLRYTNHIIQHDGVIAYPTESVYGLGCNPLSEQAVGRILQLKHRPASKGLIMIGASLDHLSPYIYLTEEQRQTILKQAQPMTWLVNKSSLTPDWVSGVHPKVAIRITQHPVAQLLCHTFGGAMISTSANPAGARPANSLLQVRQYFPDQLDAYISGKTGPLKQATPITDIETGKQFRV